MASLFNTLNIGYSGLNAAQIEVNTTGNNISNANVEGYTRQRVITTAQTPLKTSDGDVSNGTKVKDISRIFDNFVFDKYTSVSADKEYSDYNKKNLKELSTYFPDVDGVGIKSDMSSYYDAWQTLAENPDNDSAKVALAKQTESLTKHIQQTKGQVIHLQKQVNNQLSLDIKEVNSTAKQIASINTAISVAESGNGHTANDLRDKRNLLEKDLSRLIGAKVNKGDLNSNIEVDSSSNVSSGSYSVSVDGFNIVDGSSFHPLKLTNGSNSSGFYNISYERQDGVLLPMNGEITGGRIGASLDLRGRKIDTTSGMPTDGVIQTTASDLDGFSKGLIESTNNLYAQAATKKMQSVDLNVDGNTPLLNTKLNINKGSFDVIIYDVDGNEVCKRAINIDEKTTMSGAAGTDSIEGQIKDNKDDNGDNNANDDVDDYMTYSYQKAADGTQQLQLAVNSDAKSKGYTFSIKDNLTDGSFASGTNFAGSIGLGGFLEGDNASNIKLGEAFRDNPTKIHAGYSSSSGDNRVALDMGQQQFESYKFKVGDKTYDTTLYGMYDMTATYVGTSANSAITKNDSITAQFNATEMEYFSVSKVNTDEEMTNLIKYQNSYGASAKVITTVDQMMKTLLGLKQ